MGISLESLEEGCCKYPSSIAIIDGDSLDSNGATCDKILECDDRYILVEEKSILLGFFSECCTSKGKNLADFLIKKELQDDFFEFVSHLDKEEKKRIFAESVTRLLISIGSKASNTTHILATKYNSEKTSNMPIIYLYCKSGKPIDRLVNLSLSKYKNEKKEVIIECGNLENFLNKKGCI